MAPARASTSVGRETDRLLGRIRTLVHQSDRGDGADRASLRAQKREIEELKSQLAEVIERNPPRLDDDPAGA
jgi:hypothetical protein